MLKMDPGDLGAWERWDKQTQAAGDGSSESGSKKKKKKKKKGQKSQAHKFPTW